MSWFDKFKKNEENRIADFHRTLKYGSDYRKEWDELNQKILESEKRRKEIKDYLKEISGLAHLEYPRYISVLDGIYVKECKESPVGYCVVKGNVGDPIGDRDRHCLFCKKDTRP